ncbi:MarR family transcriptional regulator [Haloarcula nitratireducens]|uniref:MarR family transcriptional regulator n=1 Tax=Haloarcula nitratireducens TaxID=2487749 RepID=A0AAW4PFF9_9EURY|nr:helix-turn-helix domain-containing protein [Halomicroarcula nitratireducens]MBX0296679.1 MarR family transcriptional regulator [Halomicroarcula nitratireducens]
MTKLDNRYSEEINIVAKRAGFVEYLWNNPRRKRELVEELDYSRSTVNRAVRELKGAGFVRDKGNRHVTTLTGKYAAERYHAYIQESTDIISAREILSPLDNTLLSSEFLFDAETALLAGPAPKQPVEYLIEVAENANTISAFLPSLSDKRELELLLGLCSQRGVQLGLNFTSESLEEIVDRYPELIRGLCDNEQCTVQQGPTPDFSLYIIEAEEEASVLIIVYDEMQSAYGILKTSTATAVKEGKALLQSFSAGLTDASEEIQQETVELSSSPVEWNSLVGTTHGP